MNSRWKIILSSEKQGGWSFKKTFKVLILLLIYCLLVAIFLIGSGMVWIEVKTFGLFLNYALILSYLFKDLIYKIDVEKFTPRQILFARIAGSSVIAISILFTLLSIFVLIFTFFPQEPLNYIYSAFLFFVGLPAMGIASFRWYSHLVFKIPSKYTAIIDSLKLLKSAKHQLNIGKTGEALILADDALEKFLRYLCTRFGCTENTTIMVRSREKKFEDWGFMEYVQWLKELDKKPFTSSEKINFYEYHNWRNIVQHKRIFAPRKSDIKQVIKEIRDFIERNI